MAAIQQGAYMSLPKHIRKGLLLCRLCMCQFQPRATAGARKDVILRLPKVLGCLHTFCLKCLSDDVHSKRGHRKKTKLPCPVCAKVTVVSKGGAELLPDNLTVLGLLHLMNKTSTPTPGTGGNVSVVSVKSQAAPVAAAAASGNTGHTSAVCVNGMPNHQAQSVSVPVPPSTAMAVHVSAEPHREILNQTTTTNDAVRCALCLETGTQLDASLSCGHRPCQTCRNACQRVNVRNPECLICVTDEALAAPPGQVASVASTSTTPYQVYNTENLYPRLHDVQFEPPDDQENRPPPYTPTYDSKAAEAAASVVHPRSHVGDPPPLYPSLNAEVVPRSQFIMSEIRNPPPEYPGPTNEPHELPTQGTCDTCRNPLNLEHPRCSQPSINAIPLPGLARSTVLPPRATQTNENRPQHLTVTGTMRNFHSNPDLARISTSTENLTLNNPQPAGNQGNANPPGNPKFVINIGKQSQNLHGQTRVQVVSQSAHGTGPGIVVQKPLIDPQPIHAHSPSHQSMVQVHHSAGRDPSPTKATQQPISNNPPAKPKRVGFIDEANDAIEPVKTQLRLLRKFGGYGDNHLHPGIFQMPSRLCCAENGDILVVDSQFMCVQIFDDQGFCCRSMFKVVGIQDACYWGSQKIIAATHRGLEVYSLCGQKLQEVPMGPVLGVVAYTNCVVASQPTGLSYYTGSYMELNKQVKKKILPGMFRKQQAFHKLTSVELLPASQELAVLDAGDIYVMNEDGQVRVTITPANQSCGRLHNPSSIASDPRGNIYVCDTGNRRVIKFGSDGRFSGVVADFNSTSAQGGGDSTMTAYGLTVNKAGNQLLVTINGQKMAQVRMYALS